MKDKYGREYARYDDLHLGDEIEIDEGFNCHGPGKVKVLQSEGALYFECVAGKHLLEGQLNPDGSLMGVYKCT